MSEAMTSTQQAAVEREKIARIVMRAAEPDGLGLWETYTDVADEILSALSTPVEGEPEVVKTFRPTHRHRKRGTLYEVLGDAVLQSASDVRDDHPLIVYRGEDGQLWARPPTEFNDGRFEELSASQPPRPAQPEEVRVLVAEGGSSK